MAGLIQTLKEVFTGKKSAVSLAVGKGYTAMESRESMVTNYESFLNAGTGNVWATFKSCDLVANAVMSTTFDLIREQDITIPHMWSTHLNLERIPYRLHNLMLHSDNSFLF